MTPLNENTGIEGGWPQAGKFRRSIRFEFSIYVTLIVVALMAVTGYVMTSMYVNKTTEQVINEALVRVRSYSGPAGKLIISSDNPDALLLNNLLKRLSADYIDTYWAGIADKDGVLLAHTDLKEVLAGNRLSALSGQTESALLKAGETFLIRSDTIYLSVPIMENDFRVGTFALASSTRRIRAAELESVVRVLTITIIMILIGLPATLVVLHRKLRPVTVITDHLKNVSFDDISLNIPIKTRNEFGYLAETLAVMGARLNQAQRDKIEKDRIAREYEIAREIQASILPDHYPTGNSFAVFGAYRSAREVGGDYYDFIDFGDDKIGIIVADVSGKSLPGMLVMLLTRDIVKNLARPDIAPAALLTNVNTRLRQNIKKGMFVTMFYGVLNKKDGNLTFASAGHNPLIILPSGKPDCQQLKTPGYPLAMMAEKQFAARIENAQLNLAPGDWVVQFTDGINEARNGADEEFGMDRFVQILQSSRNLPADKMIDAVVNGVESFVGEAPQYDDITLLALKWTGHATETVGSESNSLEEVSRVY